MIVIRKEAERGKTKMHWLESQHTFSFGNYNDPNHMEFSCLRVINEDIIQPSMGFGLHAHKNMEIISYVIKGVLEHQDNIGTVTLLQPGEIQIMSAGTGIKHSEFNHSSIEPVHFLQIWIIPEKKGIQPRYRHKKIEPLNHELNLIASKEGKNGSLSIYQNLQLYIANLFPAQIIYYIFADSRCGWLQVIKGGLVLNNQLLMAGDGASILEKQIEVQATSDTEFLLFDLPKRGNIHYPT